jgi:hypothetical protein
VSEDAFNLFLFIERGVVNGLGVVVHRLEGTDEQMIARMRDAVGRDLVVCKRFALSEPFQHLSSEEYSVLCRIGRQPELFEPIFASYGAGQHPLYGVTPVIDGEIVIDVQDSHGPLLLGKFQGHPKLGLGVMPDYLEVYSTPAGLDLGALINDDYFMAIKLLFTSGRYVSCMKLLVSFIETVAFLEFGDTAGTFVLWLEKYAQIRSLGVTAPQLWELRNSLLHMSNLDSRRVSSGRETRISFFVGKRGSPAMRDMNLLYFNLTDLLATIADAVSKWVDSLSADSEKLRNFVQRYDRVISDARVAKMPSSKAPDC